MVRFKKEKEKVLNKEYVLFNMKLLFLCKRILSRAFNHNAELKIKASKKVINFENLNLLKKYEEYASKYEIAVQPYWFIEGDVTIKSKEVELDLPVLSEKELKKLKRFNLKFTEVHNHEIGFRCVHLHFITSIRNLRKVKASLKRFVKIRWS